MEGVRIDKWLWAVRVFKTRSLATEACRAGKVQLNNQELKASHTVKRGEIYNIRNGSFTRSIQVINEINHRLGAKLVPDYALDLTPKEEIEKFRIQREAAFYYRDKGAGRPTKKERRVFDEVRSELPLDDSWDNWQVTE